MTEKSPWCSFYHNIKTKKEIIGRTAKIPGLGF